MLERKEKDILQLFFFFLGKLWQLQVLDSSSFLPECEKRAKLETETVPINCWLSLNSSVWMSCKEACVSLCLCVASVKKGNY